jgi:hypothetical protein
MNLRNRKTAVLAGVAIVALVLVSVAVAAWMASGTGPGKGKSGLKALRVSQPAGDPAQLLVPGGDSQLALHVENQNARPVLVTAVSGAGVVTSDDEIACRGSAFVTFTNQASLGPQNLIVPANGSLDFFVDGLTMSSTAPDACQNRTFTVPVQVSGPMQ